MTNIDGLEMGSRIGRSLGPRVAARDHRRLGDRGRRVAAAAVGALLLSACSENVAIFATNPCPDPLTVTVADSETERRVEVPAGRTVEIWAICCEPGQAGQLDVSANGWQQTISYAELRDEPTVTLPPTVCRL